MSNFWSLYLVELKKIISKKMVWVAMTAGLGFVLLVGIMNFTSDGKQAYIKYQSETLKKITGQKMDENFFEDFKYKVNLEITEHPERYGTILEHDPGAVFSNAASNIGQNALYHSIYNVMRNRSATETVTSTSFYEAMRQNIIQDGKELGATDTEIDTWLKEYDSIEKPIVYSYALSYTNIMDVLFMVGWILFLNIAIALSGLFSDEHYYRTDSLILSSKNGRLPVGLAKICTGISVSLLQTLILCGGFLGIMITLYGSTGWNAVIQNVIPSSPWNITLGTMVLIFALLAISTSILFALINAVVSHITKSSTATLAVQTAILFIGLFNMPAKMGWFAKIWQLRPTMALYYGTFCNTFRYGRFNNVEISLIIYIVVSIMITFYLIMSYKKTQIQSR